MARRQRKRRLMANINVVPYIDVMLVLLVIFLVAAPILKQGVHVNLPQAPSKPIIKNSKYQKPFVVTVNRQGSYFVNLGATPTQALTFSDLDSIAKKVLKSHPGISIYIQGDKNVDYGRVIKVMALLQRMGASKVGLITRPPGSHG